MKNVNQNLKKWPVMIGMVCMTALILSSCSKKQDNTPVKPVSALAVIDASPGTAQLGFYLGTNLVTASPLTAGLYLNYFTTYSGKTTASFFQGGTSIPTAQDTVTLGPSHYYSLFLANTTAAPEMFLIRDSLSRPAAGTISVRLVNASPDAGGVDLIVKASGTKIVQNEPYKSASNFMTATVNPTDTLQVVKTGTSTVIATVTNVKYTVSTVYTVWVYGFANSSDANLKANAGIMANGYFY